MAQAETILQLDRIGVTYPNGIIALQPVDLELQSGRLYAIPLTNGGRRKRLYTIWRQQTDASNKQIHSFRDLLTQQACGNPNIQ